MNAWVYPNISSDFLTKWVNHAVDSVGELCALLGGETEAVMVKIYYHAAWKLLE